MVARALGRKGELVVEHNGGVIAPICGTAGKAPTNKVSFRPCQHPHSWSMSFRLTGAYLRPAGRAGSVWLHVDAGVQPRAASRDGAI